MFVDHILEAPRQYREFNQRNRTPHRQKQKLTASVVGNQEHFDRLRLIRSTNKRGLMIAEQPPGTEPRARHFPYHSRMIAGPAMGAVVFEAAPMSGPLITARLAAGAGREVMAVPCSVLDPRSHGYNELIREGATLVQNAAEIAERGAARDFRMKPRPAQPPVAAIAADVDGAAPKAVIDIMGMTYISVDELVRQSGSSQ
jgi:DNA processing protein